MFNRVMFLGSKESGLGVLQEIYRQIRDKLVACITIDDVKDTRSKLEEFANFCNSKRIPLCIMNGNKDISLCINSYKPDLCVVMGWYNLIKPETIANVRGGFIGIHNSLLPRYRGFSPVVWAMINGEKKTGFSVFSFDEGMDTGKVWYQEEVQINDDDDIESVLNRINCGVNSFLKEQLKDIISETLTPHDQINIAPTYGARRTPDDGHIDWRRKGNEIYNFIRAQSKPYPGAYTVFREKRITIWRASVFPYELFGVPGRVSLIDKNEKSIVVACGDNTGIELKVVEVDNVEGSPMLIAPTLSMQFN